ncbi:MAG: efflux RND transporter periplasmic adaptor subunit [Acidobacteria bacterium]|nr:MAG: efflux RND transporter periplasmic adaptor subunit [Acidobacteriota bacterium]PYV90475.1 MAG: efflux RND transporter periplasmic adaptor subunit [Acidobacteriota bacterium]
MRNALYGILVLSAIVVGFVLGHRHTGVQASNTGHRVLYYVDPMHPSYKSDKPGIAPDCGMQLEPVYADDGAQVPASNAPAQSTPGAVNIDPGRQQLAGIRVATVEKTPGTRTLRIPGRVTADESRVYRVNAGVDGFVRETHEDTVGSHVKKDQQLAIVYSPEFVSAIGGYFSASTQTQGGTVKEGTAGTQGQVGIQNWANRLRNLGMSDAQIGELNLTRKTPEGVYIVSPADGFIVARNISRGLRFDRNMEFYRIADLSHVWIVADLFESEAQYFHPGAVALITLPNQKKNFSARVSDILPQVDPVTRAVKLRLEVDNKNLTLRPDTFVDVDLTVATPSGLSVPADAVLDSGLSKQVFVDRGNGIFEPRQVDTGEPFGDRVQILRGLAEGEKVVASGTFLVDSESRLKSVPQNAPRTGTMHTGKRGSEMVEAAGTGF